MTFHECRGPVSVANHTAKTAVGFLDDSNQSEEAMTRTILSSFAVVAMLATSATPAVSQAKLSGQRPVPCDCTNCSAEHCQPPGPGPSPLQTYRKDLTRNFIFMKSTWELHLSTGARNVPPPDCPPLDPKDCLASWV